MLRSANIALFIALAALLLHVDIFSQKNFHVTIEHYENGQIKEFKIKDSLKLKQHFTSYVFDYQRKGYLLAGFDSVKQKDQQVHAYFSEGSRFESIVLSVEQEEIDFLRKRSSLNEKILLNAPLHAQEYARLFRSIHESYLNNGYPFCKIQVDSIGFQDKQIDARLTINRGPYYEWRNIIIKGDSAISSKYISNYLQIKEGDVYSEQLLQQISSRIEQINFISEIKQHEILFTPNGADLYLYLKSNPTSLINGIVGLQPDPVTQKSFLTGELNLKLTNAFHHGELLAFNWRSIQPQTQNLKFNLTYPFLFQTPFGIDGRFSLYKRDTSFIESNARIGVIYIFRGNNSLTGFYENYNSSLLQSANQGLGALASVKTNQYGLTIQSKKVDYLPNPSKGYSIFFEMSAGTRSSRQTDTTDYIQNTVYRGLVNLEFYFPLTKRHLLYFKQQTGFYSAEVIYYNELLRFGGLQQQRGFNEEELRASTVVSGTIEYRYLVDRNSFAFVFYDHSWFENTSNGYFNGEARGFGTGFSFGTKIGIFSISYALGQYDGPLLLRNGKVHFGYIAYF